MSDLSGRLARLSQEERALLFEKLRRRKEHDGAAEAPAIPRRTGEGPPPLSFAQQRLWFLDRLAPGDPSYNVPMATLFHGPVDLAALARALAAVSARHESLRTTFGVAADGSPVQIIAPSLAVPVPAVDLSRLDSQDGRQNGRLDAEVERLCREVFHLPFDLAAGPLWRAVLLRLGPERHVLILVQHHIVSDGWSIGVLVRDALALYRVCLTGEDPAGALPPLPLQYADFAVWQRSWLSGERLERQIAVWRNRLGALPPPLLLPTDRQRPPLKGSHGAFHDLHLSAAAVARLHAVAREEGATPYMVLLAAFQVFLGRYSGQTDFAVGSAVANRNRPELADLIGFFVNTLALRADLSGDPAVRELLARVRDVALEAFAHQDLPFEKLVEELRPERDPSRTPIFQVSFSLLNTPKPRVDFGGLSIEILRPDPGLVKFDVDLGFEPRAPGSAGDPEGLQGSMGYSTDLFDAATAARMAGHFSTLLTAVLADRAPRLSELPLLSDAERRQLLEEWNRTAAGAPRELAPVDLVRERAAARPEAPAVVWAGGVLTYGTLMETAGRWARRLRALGVGPEVPVAVLLPGSPQLVTAVLAAALAGGAYLPIDPAYPDERIAAILSDAGAGAALTSAALAHRLPGRTVLCLDREEEGWPEEAVEEAADAGPAALAYVIYTSGSTGTPKGVGVPRGALLNLLAWNLRHLAAAPGERVAVTAGPGFDASVWELWAALTSGAAVCLPDEEARLSPPRLVEWLDREGIDFAFFPTPLAEAVLAEPALARTRLRRLMTGGDRLHRIARRDLRFPVVNLYGPSEATVIATCAPEAQRERDRDPSIGKPLDNARAYVLDAAGRPAPVGVPGELWVGGEILARGYLGRPGLTAAAYRPDPFLAVSGARMYATGDLVRWRPDGELEVLGRLDGQVKVRGFRIELGEVEAALLRHPEVRQAVVLACGGASGGHLAAFVVPREGADRHGEAVLRAHLRRLLPEPMVPAVFVCLDALPLTPGGKVDRQALERLAPSSAAAAGAPTPPRTDTERLLAGLWSAVLGREKVGVDESFFDLGGHSLLLARVQAKLAEALGREVPLLKLIEHPTVGSLAAWLDGEGGAAPAAAAAGASRDRAVRQRHALELQRRRTARRPAPGEAAG